MPTGNRPISEGRTSRSRTVGVVPPFSASLRSFPGRDGLQGPGPRGVVDLPPRQTFSMSPLAMGVTQKDAPPHGGRYPPNPKAAAEQAADSCHGSFETESGKTCLELMSHLLYKTRKIVEPKRGKVARTLLKIGDSSGEELLLRAPRMVDRPRGFRGDAWGNHDRVAPRTCCCSRGLLDRRIVPHRPWFARETERF